METIENIAFVLIGWVLGLLGNHVWQSMQDRRLLEEARNVLAAELRAYRYRMAIANWDFALFFQKLDRQTIQWVLPIMKAYEGPDASEETLKIIEKLDKASDEEVGTMNNHTQPNPNASKSLKKHGLNFLSSRLDAIQKFSPKCQFQLLELLAQKEILDQQIDDTRTLHWMTFENGLSDENRTIIDHNLRALYRNIQSRCKQMADDIGRIELK